MENNLPPQNSSSQNGNYAVPKENLLMENPFVKNKILIVGLVIFLALFFTAEIYILFRYMSETKEVAKKIETSANQILTPVPTQPTSMASEKMEDWKTYINEEYGFEFRYPGTTLEIEERQGTVRLFHTLPYKHENPCNLKERAMIPTVVDFSVSFEMVKSNLSDTLRKKESSYVVERYLKSNTLTLEPGFIDSVQVGKLRGYKITSGVEGCGNYTYYFPVTTGDTLIVVQAMLTELIPAVTYYQEVLQIPGIIPPEEEKKLFTQILSTFKFTDPDQVEKDIKSILPAGSFLRDFEPLPNTTNGLYFVLYVEKDYEFYDSGFYSCPGAILGKAIVGNYHFALYQNKKLVNDLLIPSAYSFGIKPEKLTLSYQNTKENLYPPDTYSKEEKDVLETVKLLKLQDYTGDGKAYEFLLTTTGGGCGFFDGLVAGHDSETGKTILYSDWIERFRPDSDGNYSYLFECGDHGNMTKVEAQYAFDNATKRFKKVWEKSTPCLTY